METSERLIVAADYDPRKFGGINGVREEVLRLADALEGLGIIIKVNSILRACGYGLIRELHDLGLRVFADLKLVDIPNTMEMDGAMLAEVKPELLTVMCCAGIDGMASVQKVVGGDTEVLGVSVLTSLDEEECQTIFTCSTKAGVLRFARMAQLAGLGGLILSSQEAEMLSKKKELVLSLNTPGIRPGWSLVAGDDQKRVMTPGKAIEAGARRIVIGRLITQTDNPREAVSKTLREIEEALSKGGV
ncbi:MAG TPA: orotidine-5'-phosphate decarboxylase [Candidatus Humimicrobiaceae bacterium]|nr:orotidine-5'-phosphate decarboxylase [Candidatus Humimicrobiaceae bacterium]